MRDDGNQKVKICGSFTYFIKFSTSQARWSNLKFLLKFIVQTASSHAERRLAKYQLKLSKGTFVFI